jgi:protein TonB
MFDQLLDSTPCATGRRSIWTVILAAALHALAIVAIVATGYLVVGAVIEPDLPIWFVATATLPPPAPPPPPPAPPAGSSEPERLVEEVEPVEPDELFQPEEVPEVVADLATVGEDGEASDEGGVAGGAPGGVPGGVAGGVPGGTPGGVKDGVVGGTGDDDPRVITGEIEPPELIEKIRPEYPEIPRRARMQGRVILQAVIGTRGDVEDVTILRSPSELFNESAVAAVRRWRYRPARQSGRPVAVYFTVVVDFTLH